MPNSKLGLTNAFYNLVITICDQLVIVLFIMPRVWSALATAVCVCIVNFNSLSTMNISIVDYDYEYILYPIKVS